MLPLYWQTIVRLHHVKDRGANVIPHTQGAHYVCRTPISVLSGVLESEKLSGIP